MATRLGICNYFEQVHDEKIGDFSRSEEDMDYGEYGVEEDPIKEKWKGELPQQKQNFSL